MNRRFTSIIIAIVGFGMVLVAQNDSVEHKAFDAGLHLKNMHTWRGSVVTSGAMFASSIEYNTPNDKLTLGLWGGAGFTGEYKEFTYYASYSFNKHFFAEIVSHNNYSEIENPDIFSYDKYTSPNFVDIAVRYTVSEKVPLSFFWATILAGQAQDYEVDENGHITNSWSNYLEMKYRAWEKNGAELSLFVGGAFSFSTEKTFYSDKTNIVNAGINLIKPVTVFNHTIPLDFTALWNPEQKVGVLQVDIPLF